MNTKREYAKPKVDSRKITMGVYGNYGGVSDTSPGANAQKPPTILPHQDP